MAAIPNIKLNNGHDMPQVGFGLWKVDNNICADVVYNAIKAGYRLLDGACDYGNEVECGQGVARAIKEGLVKREELFIVSKLWASFHDGDRVEQAARRSLDDWGLNYFDLYLVHFPVALEYVDPAVRYPPGWHYDAAGKEERRGKATIQETWRAMEALVAKGLARSIGVCNFQNQLLYDLLNYAVVRPATLQIEHHPYLAQAELLALCRQEGIAVTAYSSFGPTSFGGDATYDAERLRGIGSLLQDSAIAAIAERVGKTPAQVLLRWATQRGVAVIPKSAREQNMVSNLGCVGWDLPQEDMDAIGAMDKAFRFNAPYHYFKTQQLWIFS